MHAHERKKGDRRRRHKDGGDKIADVEQGEGVERDPRRHKRHSKQQKAEDDPEGLTVQERQKRHAVKKPGQNLFEKVSHDPNAEQANVVVKPPPERALAEDPFEEASMGKQQRGK